MPKVLILYPNSLRYYFVPIGLASIATVARQAGCEVSLCDLTFIDDASVVAHLHNSLLTNTPDILAVHCSSADWPLVELCLESIPDLIKNKLITVIGGPHATALPEQLIASAHIDVVVIGEGEESFRHLLINLIAGNGSYDSPGCWSKKGKSIIKNDVANLLENLDELPIPSWELFDRRHLMTSEDGGRTFRIEGGIETSRGCNLACAYCFTDRMRRLYNGKGKFCRHKSVERVLFEGRLIRDKLGLDFLHLVDDNFISSLPRLEALAVSFPKEVGLPLFLQASADRINSTTAKLLAEMGVKCVGIGVEVGDDTYRNSVLLKKATNDQLVQAFADLKNFGISPWAYYMIGLPFQRSEHLDALVRLDKRLQPDKAFVSTYYPFPGTKLYDLITDSGNMSASDKGPDFFSGLSLVKVPGVSTEESESYRKYFPHAYRRSLTAQGRNLDVVRSAKKFTC